MWVNLTDAQIALLRAVVEDPTSTPDVTPFQEILTGIVDQEVDRQTHAKILDGLAENSEDINIENNGPISVAGDGIWVMAWLWVSDGSPDEADEIDLYGEEDGV